MIGLGKSKGGAPSVGVIRATGGKVRPDAVLLGLREARSGLMLWRGLPEALMLWTQPKLVQVHGLG